MAVAVTMTQTSKQHDMSNTYITDRLTTLKTNIDILFNNEEVYHILNSERFGEWLVLH